ncbi:MAG: glycosyltransferase [Lachnospiraceae bacterium]|nr:glycosyltransferase [Lachnospiraceae bacterium]
MLKPKISVIVSIYNIQEYLPKAVDSILEQSYTGLEIILVDDGSTDSSGKICDDYAARDERIKVIHQKNRGLSGARNAGIREATGEYIAFVDGDDWIDPTMYEDMLKAMEKHNAPLAICNYKEVSESGVWDGSTDEITVWEGREALKVFVEEDERYQIQNAAWNKLYTRKLMGNLRFPEGKLFEDIVYTTRLIAASEKTVYLNRAYYNYVTDRGSSIMNSKKVEKILTDQVPAYQEKGAFLKEIGEEELLRTHQYFFMKRMLLHYREAGERKPEGYQEFLKGLRELILKEVDWAVYEGYSSRKGEYVRMKLFVHSPRAYLCFIQLNENLIIPMKQRKGFGDKKQIIIVLSGGLGNQMFQYALYLYFQAKGVEVKMDDTTEYLHEKKRKPQLGIFGIRYERATPEEIRHYTDSYMDLPSRVRRKLFGRKSRLYMDGYHFDPAVLDMEDGYLYGWWQSEKYFQEVANQVRQAFVLPQRLLTGENRAYGIRLQECESVGVHIRRGDYLEVDELYGGICTEEYYRKAMEKMRRQVPGCSFFIFTNDPDWAREHMQGEDIHIVEENDEAHGYLDLYLMSRCRHNIIANSSFSWWAAWLNENPAKKIIAPSRWVNGREMPDIYTKEMDTCI